MKKQIIAALLAATACSVSAAEVSYAYAMYGAQELAPLQVFDNGSSMYLQMPSHRLAAPPIPFTENGEPIQYEIEGPYLKMPIHDRVVLRVGSTRVYLQSSRDGEGGKYRSSNGVLGKNVWYGAAPPASVTGAAPKPAPAPRIEKLDPTELTEKPLAEEPAAKPVVAKKDDSAPVSTAPAASQSAGAAMTGRFFTAEQDDLSEVMLPVAGALTSDNIKKIAKVNKVTIEADGTSAGYRKALAIKDAVRHTTTATIQSVGAPAGHVRIVSGAQ